MRSVFCLLAVACLAVAFSGSASAKIMVLPTEENLQKLVQEMPLDQLEGVLKDLASCNVSFNRPDKDGWTLLHYAAFAFKADAGERISLLVRYGVDVDVRTAVTGCTALHLASETGNIVAVEALLAAGAKPWARDNIGSTPLHGAALAPLEDAEKLRLCQILVAAGCRRYARDVLGSTPYYLAWEGHARTKEFLRP